MLQEGIESHINVFIVASKVLFAGVISVLGALVINNHLPKTADMVVIPFIEESLKNGLAYLFNVSPLPVHLIFGLAEGIAESRSSKNYWLFGNALLGHGIYGAAAYLLWSRPLIAFLAAFVLHALYNKSIVKLFEKSK